jgi:hypothetical protein
MLYHGMPPARLQRWLNAMIVIAVGLGLLPALAHHERS